MNEPLNPILFNRLFDRVLLVLIFAVIMVGPWILNIIYGQAVTLIFELPLLFAVLYFLLAFANFVKAYSAGYTPQEYRKFDPRSHLYKIYPKSSAEVALGFRGLWDFPFAWGHRGLAVGLILAHIFIQPGSAALTDSRGQSILVLVVYAIVLPAVALVVHSHNKNRQIAETQRTLEGRNRK